MVINTAVIKKGASGPCQEGRQLQMMEKSTHLSSREASICKMNMTHQANSGASYVRSPCPGDRKDPPPILSIFCPHTKVYLLHGCNKCSRHRLKQCDSREDPDSKERRDKTYCQVEWNQCLQRCKAALRNEGTA